MTGYPGGYRLIPGGLWSPCGCVWGAVGTPDPLWRVWRPLEASGATLEASLWEVGFRVWGFALRLASALGSAAGVVSACSWHAAGVVLVLDRQQAGSGERLSVTTVGELDRGVASDR